MKYAIAIALLGVTSVSASPYYVGENLNPQNNITLGFTDTPTKKTAPASTGKTGNIIALDIKGAYNVAEGTSMRADLPFYMINKNAAGTARNAVGNISIGGIYGQSYKSEDQAWTYGYTLSSDIFAPTNRKNEGGTLAAANPTTDLWKFYPRALAVTPTVGIHAGKDMFRVKSNLGGAWAYLGKKSGLPTDQNRLAINWQLAGTWHAMPNVHANLEYNTVFLDTATAQDLTGKNTKFRHAVTPSIAGNYEQMLASAYATLPLDSTTRDVSNVSFGLNAGYAF